MSDVITKYVKKKLGVDMGRIGSMSSFYGFLYWDMMPLIIKIYKEN